MPPKKKTEAQIARQRAKDNKKRQTLNSQIAQDHANAGAEAGVAKEAERRAIAVQLATLGLDIVQVPANGDCLFASVLQQSTLLPPQTIATSAGSMPKDAMGMRRLLAEFIRSRATDFGPFVATCDVASGPATAGGGAAAVTQQHDDDDDDEAAARQREMTQRVEGYCDAMARNSMVWGSHLELAASAGLFGRPIRVVSAAGVETVSPMQQSGNDGEAQTSSAWTVVFWQHLYALGAHYTGTKPRLQTQQPLHRAAANDNNNEDLPDNNGDNNDAVDDDG